jgi:hypothetical protein
MGISAHRRSQLQAGLQSSPVAHAQTDGPASGGGEPPSTGPASTLEPASTPASAPADGPAGTQTSMAAPGRAKRRSQV